MRDALWSGQSQTRRWPLAPFLVLSMLATVAAQAQGLTANPVMEPTPIPTAAPTGLVTIESDSQKADNATGIITAIGNVRILYPDRRTVATSRQAQYFTKEGRIVLTGDVDVVQEGGNRLRAERVVYLVDSERVLAEPTGGQQVFSQFRLQQNPVPPAAAKPQ